MTRSGPSHVVPHPHVTEGGRTELSETDLAVQKDRCLGEIFDLTPARTAGLAKAIWDATAPEDFVEMGVRAICPEHHQTRRSEAVAALVKCDPKTGGRISRNETQHAKTWPLQLAGVLKFLTFDGLVAYICAVAGTDEASARAMIRAALGPERTP